MRRLPSGTNSLGNGIGRSAESVGSPVLRLVRVAEGGAPRKGEALLGMLRRRDHGSDPLLQRMLCRVSRDRRCPAFHSGRRPGFSRILPPPCKSIPQREGGGRARIPPIAHRNQAELRIPVAAL